MYNPVHFRQEDRAQARALIEHSPLALVLCMNENLFEANHIPLQWVECGESTAVLRGHVARANPIVQIARTGCPALAVFQRVEHYITPSWYPEKKEHGKVVPTWNYEVVHVHGSLQSHDDPDFIHKQVSALTDQLEQQHESPWAVLDAPAAFIERQLKAIVGIELTIERIEAKSKLSQNKSATSRQGVLNGLGASSDPDARQMLARMKGRP